MFLSTDRSPTTRVIPRRRPCLSRTQGRLDSSTKTRLVIMSLHSEFKCLSMRDFVHAFERLPNSAWMAMARALRGDGSRASVQWCRSEWNRLCRVHDSHDSAEASVEPLWLAPTTDQVTTLSHKRTRDNITMESARVDDSLHDFDFANSVMPLDEKELAYLGDLTGLLTTTKSTKRHSSLSFSLEDFNAIDLTCTERLLLDSTPVDGPTHMSLNKRVCRSAISEATDAADVAFSMGWMKSTDSTKLANPVTVVSCKLFDTDYYVSDECKTALRMINRVVAC